PEKPPPPQTIISVPSQTAVCPDRASGAFVVVVAVQVSVAGLYLSPVFSPSPKLTPPHTIISLPVQTAVCCARPPGTSPVAVVHVSSTHPPSGIFGSVKL